SVPCPTWMKVAKRIVVTDSICDVAQFAALREARDVFCLGCQIDHAQFRWIGTFHQLETLRLDGTSVGDIDLPALQSCRRLRRLCLNATAVTDKGLMTVATLPLVQLSLGETEITDAGLP